MRELRIIPSYKCSVQCKFCYNLHKQTNQLLDLAKLDSFLKDNHQHFDKILITGGEPSTLDNTYFSKLLDIILQYDNYSIGISSYPTSMNNYTDNERVNYELSYDILARPYAQQAWQNIIKFPRVFDMKVTLSPLLFKYHPNKVLMMMNDIPNLKSIEFTPYYLNQITHYDIQQKYINQFFEIIFNNKMNLHYTIQNIDNIKNDNFTQPTVYIISPDNGFDLQIQDFIEYDFVLNKSVESFTYNESINLPTRYDFYNDEIKDLAKKYGLRN